MIVFQTESRTRMSQIVRECHALLRDIQRTDARETNLPKATTENVQTEWSLTGGGRLQESNLTGPLPRRGRGTFTLWKIIHCMQCLSAMCSCHQCSLYILHSIVHTGTQISENASRLKSMENH